MILRRTDMVVGLFFDLYAPEQNPAVRPCEHIPKILDRQTKAEEVRGCVRPCIGSLQCENHLSSKENSDKFYNKSLNNRVFFNQHCFNCSAKVNGEIPYTNPNP